MLPLITFLYAALSFLITLDNLLVILAVKSTSSLRKATNFSLVSLAVADLFVGVIVLPLRIVEVRAFDWSQSIYWCQCSLSLTLLSLSASVLNLLIVTIERYFAIIQPLIYQNKFTSRRIFYAIIFVWIVAFLVSFLPFYALKNNTAQERSHQHRICRFADTMSAEYLTFFAAFIVLIPTLFISYAYVKIFQAANNLRRRLNSLQVQRDGEAEIVSALKESKTAKNVGELLVMYNMLKGHCPADVPLKKQNFRVFFSHNIKRAPVLPSLTAAIAVYVTSPNLFLRLARPLDFLCVIVFYSVGLSTRLTSAIWMIPTRFLLRCYYFYLLLILYLIVYVNFQRVS